MEKESQIFKSGSHQPWEKSPSHDLRCGYTEVDPNSVNPVEHEYRELKVPAFVDKLKRGENYNG